LPTPKQIMDEFFVTSAPSARERDAHRVKLHIPFRQPAAPDRVIFVRPQPVWVPGHDGERVYGVWVASADEPLVVLARLPHSSAVTETLSSAGPHDVSSFIRV